MASVTGTETCPKEGFGSVTRHLVTWYSRLKLSGAKRNVGIILNGEQGETGGKGCATYESTFRNSLGKTEKKQANLS
jgi:hypothetical protein